LPKSSDGTTPWVNHPSGFLRRLAIQFCVPDGISDVLRHSTTKAPPLSPVAMLQPPRGYLTLAWLGLASNVLLLPGMVAVTLLQPTWRTVHIAVGAGAVLPTAAVGIVASVALLKWRAWGQILAIVALAMALAIGLPYAVVRLALLSDGRGPTALLTVLLTAAMTAALVYWCRPCIRRYLT
jgi:hypothetical protein